MKELFIIVTNPLWAWWLQYRCIVCRNALRNISDYYRSIAAWIIPSNHHMVVLAIKRLSDAAACQDSSTILIRNSYNRDQRLVKKRLWLTKTSGYFASKFSALQKLTEVWYSYQYYTEIISLNMYDSNGNLVWMLYFSFPVHFNCMYGRWTVNIKISDIGNFDYHV